MTDFGVSESVNEERACGGISVGEDRLPHAQAQSRQWPAGVPDGSGASENEPCIRVQDSERTRCEVWTRVMGYHRPVSAFNAGKLTEHKERRYFMERRTGRAHQAEQAA